MTQPLNQSVLEIELSGIRRFTALAKQDPDCLSLAIGEPDFHTPDPIKEAAKQALDQNNTHYPPSVGIPELLSRIRNFEKEKNDLDYAEDEILVTCGASEGMFVALGGILNPGDEVVVPVPAFGLYEPIIKIFRAVYRPLDTTGDDFQITESALENALSSKTKAILLNSPNNPTGTVYTKETLEIVLRAAKKYNTFVICDDVYAQLIYGPYESFAKFQDFRENIIVVQSFSKPYAMTGWRAGYILADRPVAKALLKLHSYCALSAVSFVQSGCLAALDYNPAAMVETYRARRDYSYARLAEMGLPLSLPQGAFYLFPSIEKFGLSSETFCLRMIQEAKLAAVPGSCFGVEGYIRLSYCYSEEELSQSFHRLHGFLKTLR